MTDDRMEDWKEGDSRGRGRGVWGSNDQIGMGIGMTRKGWRGCLPCETMAGMKVGVGLVARVCVDG